MADALEPGLAMLWIRAVLDSPKRVIEDTDRLVERNLVLLRIDHVLSWIPLKSRREVLLIKILRCSTSRNEKLAITQWSA
jgi:hypothetical protein